MSLRLSSRARIQCYQKQMTLNTARKFWGVMNEGAGFTYERLRLKLEHATQGVIDTINRPPAALNFALSIVTQPRKVNKFGDNKASPEVMLRAAYIYLAVLYIQAFNPLPSRCTSRSLFKSILLLIMPVNQMYVTMGV